MRDLHKIADELLSRAKEAGADMARCVVTESEKQEFNVESDAFTLMRTLFDNSLSLTVYREGRQGTVSFNRLDGDAAGSAVAEAMAAAESAQPDPAWQICSSGECRTFVHGPQEPDTDKLFRRTAELLSDIRQRYPKLLVESIISEYVRGRAVYKNSYGTTYDTRTGWYAFSAGYSAHEGESSSHSFGSMQVFYDLDAPFISRSGVEKDLEYCERQAVPEAFGEKFVGTVLFMPGCLADVVFGTILGSFVSDLPLIDGTSTWKDKIGEKVADERISVRIAPGDPRIFVGSDYSGEGYLNEDFDLIRNGVLENFMLSQYGANKTGRKRSGNTAGTLVVEAGDTPLDEIIGGIGRGILIGRFSGGQPGANGEFSGIAKNSFLIEDGKITCALAETMISGNLNDMLHSLRAVSLETLEDGRMVMPYMAFDGVTVSGK